METKRLTRSEARRKEWQDPDIRAKRLANKHRFMPGHKHSADTLEKLREAMKGRHISPSTEFKKGQTAVNKGKHIPNNAGEKHYNWKGGITPWWHKERTSLEFRQWREAVLERDNYTCQMCGESKEIMHTDHIKPFREYPELRYDINNGRVLCPPCHFKTDTWGNKKKHKEIREGGDKHA